MTKIRITHRPSGSLLAEGTLGSDIRRFEGNYYIRKRCLRDVRFRPSWIPGLCVYKFLYVWMNARLRSGEVLHGIGWLYWLPNPLLPFIAFRIALPGGHPDLEVETVTHAS